MQVIGMGGIRTRPERGHEGAAGGLPYRLEKAVLRQTLRLLDRDLQRLGATPQLEGEDIERLTGRMLADRAGRGAVAPPAFMAAADTQGHEIPLEMAARQGLDAAVEPTGKRAGHGTAQQGRGLEGHDRGAALSPDGKRLDTNGVADPAGRIAVLRGGTGRRYPVAGKRRQCREA